MDLNQRRALLKTENNPNKSIDYIIRLSAEKIEVCYIPDKMILAVGSLENYVNNTAETESASIETVAASVLSDLNNELVPRWIQVCLRSTNENGSIHDVVMEDRQPQWHNPHLLERIAKI